MQVCYAIQYLWRRISYSIEDLVPGEMINASTELCRDLAGRFNQKYSETFAIPKPFIPKTGAALYRLSIDKKNVQIRHQ